MLYLLGDTTIGPVGLNHAAKKDADAIIVLIKDGVFLNTQAVKGKKIYAIDEDVKRRGMGDRLEDKAEIIGYDKLVDLIMENKVANYV
jgi:sulfur relay protein TusB/DsrH